MDLIEAHALRNMYNMFIIFFLFYCFFFLQINHKKIKKKTHRKKSSRGENEIKQIII